MHASTRHDAAIDEGPLLLVCTRGLDKMTSGRWQPIRDAFLLLFLSWPDAPLGGPAGSCWHAVSRSGRLYLSRSGKSLVASGRRCEAGVRLQPQEMSVGVRCAAPVGERLWVGLADGGVRVFETGPKAVLLAHFEAHDSAVVSIAQAR